MSVIFASTMSQFNYLNEINSIFKMDGDLAGNCPAPRWQKKQDSTNTSMLSGSINTSKLSMSYNNSYSTMAASLAGKTPQKAVKSPSELWLFYIVKLGTNILWTFVCNAGRKTTPNNAVKTPSGGDRFIPNRSASNFDLGHYKVN